MEQVVFPETPVLLVDDQKDFLNSMCFSLRTQGITNLHCCEESRELMAMLEKKKFSLILLDISMPHISGSELLKQIVEEYPEIPVIMLTALNEVETAVDCMKNGAFDYLVKPIDTYNLVKTIRRTLGLLDLKEENTLLQESLLSESLKYPEAFSELVTQNRKMLNIFKNIEAIAVSKLPILITGEDGTGKELIARAIHKVSGRSGNFIEKNIAGMDDTILADELFGNRKGKGKGKKRGLVEQAMNGTLFLDEIGDISLESQALLLRLIPMQEYRPLSKDIPPTLDICLVAATHRNIKFMVETGEFRKDLYHRLRSHHIHLPPLRERKEDIPLLVDHFITLAVKVFKKKKPRIPKGLLELLANYSFPGNIRELGGMIADAMSRHKSGILSLDVFKEKIEEQCGRKEFTFSSTNPDHVIPKVKTITFGDSFPTFAEMEAIYLNEALERAQGDQKKAADLTGLHSDVIANFLKKRVLKNE